MNVLFLSLGELDDLSTGSVHIDIIKEIAKHHNVYLVAKRERRKKLNTELTQEFGINVLRVKTGNLKKVNVIEKGISTLLLEGQYKRAIKKYFKGVKFDLVLYSTPPITFAKVVEYIKKRDGARTYLLLKDIFPQNAVDIGMLKTTGIKGLIYQFFRKKEKKLYAFSDTIGCMSQANCDYILRENPEIPPQKVEICPNSIDVKETSVTAEERSAMREKYGIPQDKKVFVYGGNLGKPQGIPFLVECLERVKNTDGYFLIVGDGTEFSYLQHWFEENKPSNIQLLKRLPKADYDKLVAACDVGMIFLDKRFTIPNFPSRLLAYMQAKLPVLSCTDRNTDVGEVIQEGKFGWSCFSDDVSGFAECVNQALTADLKPLGENAYAYLKENYSVENAYTIIVGGRQV
ncbi:MAG: glycosyltransferase family 4 protein [Clostridia bacterium]|nr:glycosyltransferase family 4 protein [Clostridia bacterium]